MSLPYQTPPIVPKKAPELQHKYYETHKWNTIDEEVHAFLEKEPLFKKQLCPPGSDIEKLYPEGGLSEHLYPWYLVQYGTWPNMILRLPLDYPKNPPKVFTLVDNTLCPVVCPSLQNWSDRLDLITIIQPLRDEISHSIHPTSTRAAPPALPKKPEERIEQKKHESLTTPQQFGPSAPPILPPKPGKQIRTNEKSKDASVPMSLAMKATRTPTEPPPLPAKPFPSLPPKPHRSTASSASSVSQSPRHNISASSSFQNLLDDIPPASPSSIVSRSPTILGETLLPSTVSAEVPHVAERLRRSIEADRLNELRTARKLEVVEQGMDAEEAELLDVLRKMETSLDTIRHGRQQIKVSMDKVTELKRMSDDDIYKQMMPKQASITELSAKDSDLEFGIQTLDDALAAQVLPVNTWITSMKKLARCQFFVRDKMRQILDE
ncbi:ESCRT I complex subunit Vps23 [Schizosaccharomyces japonicus yFS275]|uniref:ESCRT I complex subunit Vps23 n=1 Tax=Schizosaccharomyces japonicus (strain yFS275 / FY16936) TaxID=402676 RepID=B6JZE4_SCHJY|nr:ESCRT I complex subunit Vps23 [Schizosaccharomyces japonicus yFS275]EEB06912.1 ESCRT I complex subunit Vps23 [Schizosaccharomyces japonicus yFS275]